MIADFLARLLFSLYIQNQSYAAPLTLQERIDGAATVIKYGCVVESAEFVRRDGGAGAISNAPKSLFITARLLQFQNIHAPIGGFAGLDSLNYQTIINHGDEKWTLYSSDRWGFFGADLRGNQLLTLRDFNPLGEDAKEPISFTFYLGIIPLTQVSSSEGFRAAPPLRMRKFARAV